MLNSCLRLTLWWHKEPWQALCSGSPHTHITVLSPLLAVTGSAWDAVTKHSRWCWTSRNKQKSNEIYTVWPWKLRPEVSSLLWVSVWFSDACSLHWPSRSCSWLSNYSSAWRGDFSPPSNFSSLALLGWGLAAGSEASHSGITIL